MKKIAFLVLTLAIIACGKQTTGIVANAVVNNSVAETDKDKVPQRSDYTFRTEVRTTNEDGDVLWGPIIVYLTDTKGQTQELHSEALPLDTVNWNKGSIGEILEDDWNFDGIPDLQVCTGPMNGFGNYTYDVWLWNDKTHKFEKLNYDVEIYSPEIDSENKCIISNWRLDDDLEFVTYQWKNGKLVETKREQKSYSEMMKD